MPELKNLSKNKFISIAQQAAEEKWKEQFAQLIQFKNDYGMLPQSKTDNTLCNWLIMQRKKAKNGELTEEQLQLYRDAGINVLGRPQKTSLN